MKINSFPKKKFLFPKKTIVQQFRVSCHMGADILEMFVCALRDGKLFFPMNILFVSAGRGCQRTLLIRLF